MQFAPSLWLTRISCTLNAHGNCLVSCNDRTFPTSSSIYRNIHCQRQARGHTGVGAARMSEYRLKVSELPDQRDAPPLARRFCARQHLKHTRQCTDTSANGRPGGAEPVTRSEDMCDMGHQGCRRMANRRTSAVPRLSHRWCRLVRLILGRRLGPLRASAGPDLVGAPLTLWRSCCLHTVAVAS